MAKARIANLPREEAAEFGLTTSNKDEASHVFIMTPDQPLEWEGREGRNGLPDDSWISFSSQKIQVTADSQSNVTVRVAIPRE